MNTLIPTIARWGVRAHLIGFGVILAYGFHQGDLTAPFQEGLFSVLYHPILIGFSIGMTGTIKVSADNRKTASNSTTELYESEDTEHDSRYSDDLYEDQMRRDEAAITGDYTW